MKIRLIFISICIFTFMILYVVSTFSYSVSDNCIVMRWYILKYLPFGYRKIPLSTINEVKSFEFSDFVRGGYIFGNIFTKKGVTIVLTKKFYFTNRIFITPSKSDMFIGQINSLLKGTNLGASAMH